MNTVFGLEKWKIPANETDLPGFLRQNKGMT